VQLFTKTLLHHRDSSADIARGSKDRPTLVIDIDDEARSTKKERQ